ncbi:male-enhanced antigen 1 [Anopheles aquasalis]|uniref:male-enhanced antigen 1 n=1 Tax=Anopheles aquasalis TaxID=42839 RepID=UPI00215B2FB0|nr:male-enhanced antigen 1 [Anopheles aquasalis]XP_050101250.1 male-enhanced antigen 1 [Anopheles aquasalis]
MGLPDLPGQQGEDNNFTMDDNHIIHVEPLSEDESENDLPEENYNGYAGYQPLSVDERNPSTIQMTPMDHYEAHSDEFEPGSAVADTDSSNHIEFLNLDVWNAPRPEELNIDIDANKAAEIVNVMAGIKLPTTAVPDWARGVPEEEWKENLLQRIRQRQQPEPVEGYSSSSSSSNGAGTASLEVPLPVSDSSG